MPHPQADLMLAPPSNALLIKVNVNIKVNAFFYRRYCLPPRPLPLSPLPLLFFTLGKKENSSVIKETKKENKEKCSSLANFQA